MSWNRAMTKPHLIPRSCKHCGHMMSADELKERNDIRRAKIEASLNQRLREGRPVGRPRQRNDDDIARLRSQGISIRKIAKALGISPSTVQESIKSLRSKGLP